MTFLNHSPAEHRDYIGGFRDKSKMISILEDGEVALAPRSGGEWRGVYSSAPLETLAGMAVYVHADTEWCVS